jgi:hypothetical protein
MLGLYPTTVKHEPTYPINLPDAGCPRFASVLWTLTWVEEHSRWPADPLSRFSKAGIPRWVAHLHNFVIPAQAQRSEGNGEPARFAEAPSGAEGEVQGDLVLAATRREIPYRASCSSK